MPAGKHRQRRSKKRRAGPARNIPGIQVVGLFAGHLLTNTVLLLLTLLLNGLVTILILYLPQLVADVVFLGFAHLMHIVVLIFDGVLLLCWLTYWLWRGLEEMR
ncbi:hypothetical protein [Massilia sp. YIM B04103]|uniref:hypothetical protein n=1 Tax=Massilia sp. YIM B04103 TaxID=2963106 RepID=UPI00210CFDFF|nr:hypothetical protein [Massilia sp. YIM B04103]